MFYLQGNKFDFVARMSELAGPLEMLRKSESEEAKSAQKTGLFADVDGRLVCLFRLDGALWLRVDDFVVRIDDSMHAHWDLLQNAEGKMRGRFRLDRAGESLIDFEYRPFGNRKIIPGDMTPFVDEEDYDFLILVEHVLEEPGRRDRFFQQPYVR